ncbi:MAG: type VI secretion system membrane subunit TssM, partial [Rhodothermales bacterium]
AQQQLISTRPDKQNEIQELQRQLEQAIDQLKQSKLGRGKRGRAALYALPWYLFIGPPGAGKTTAIVNSGLNFPIGTDRVRGVGGTRNCDWFFSDQAILLDTAGRYMTEQEDTEEWLAFLDTLKQHRTERPINGVIVGIAMPDLAIATPDEIEWHADNIRRRADELVKHLGVRFPIYLVFTKCDMLQGFVEFYGEYSRRDREQIWGCSLDDQQQESQNLRAVFEEEFERLVNALINRRSARLSRPMKREERQKVYAFPLQLASVKDNLALFVNRLFQPNPYQENPIFRGFYFTSGTQEGVPLDRVILSIARQFELPTTGLQQLAPETEAKAYFIKDVFTDVLIPDQYMVRHTSKASTKVRFRRMGVTVAAAVLLGMFILGASQAVVRGKMTLSETEDAATSVGAVQWSNRAAAVDNLVRIDGLRQQVENLDKSALLGLGLYRNGTVQGPARKLYLDNVRTYIRNYPLQQLEQRITQTMRSVQLEDAERDSLTSDLKAYLLLTNYEENTARLEEEGNRNFLIRHLSNLGTNQLEPQATGMTRGELRAHIEPQVTAYIDALEEDVSWAFASELRLIQGARSSIRQPISVRVLYERMRREGRDNLRPFTLADVPGRYRDLLTSNTEVSGFFTLQGWETYVNDKIDEVSQNPTSEDWVMGQTGDDDAVDLGSQQQVAADLEEMYFNDYVGAWLNFMRSVRVQGFGSLRDAARAMNALGDESESPIAYLLTYATNETRFESEIAGQIEGELADVARRRAERAIRRVNPRSRARVGGVPDDRHPVDGRFQWLHAMQADLSATGGASPDLYKAFTSFREIGSALDGMIGDPFSAAEYASGVLSRDGGDLERMMRSINDALSTFNGEVRRQLFEVPVTQAWAAVVAATQQYVNERWREVVHDPFRNSLAGLYPFNAGSEFEAPLFDVEGFFNPQSGVVATFMKEELEPYVGTNVERPKMWRGIGLRLSTPAKEALRRAKSIGENAFSGGQLRIEFEIQPEVPTRTANAPAPQRVYINVHGTENTYQMGSFRPWVPVTWPDRPGVVMTVATQVSELPSRNYDGDWALFRMLRDARITPRTSAEYRMEWAFEQPGQYTITAQYNVRTRSGSNPFNDPRGFFNFRPPSSLN